MGKFPLTFGAVSTPGQVSLPARQADLLSVLSAGEVPELVVARLADEVADAPVVGVGAHEPILEFEARVAAPAPGGARVERAGIRKSMQKRLT